MKRLLILCVCLVAVSAQAATLEWDHDCDNTTGFNVYRSVGFDKNPQMVVSVDCPATQAEIFFPGWFVISAYNDYGESALSNTILLAQYYFHAEKWEYEVVNGFKRILYKGEHTTRNAATDDPNWTIKRHYYDVDNYLIDVKIKTSSWDDRAVGW